MTLFGVYAADSTDIYDGTTQFLGGSVDAGALHVNGYLGATVEFQADISNAPVLAASLELHGTSVLTGSADVTVSGLFLWENGTLSGTGELIATAGS